MIGVDFAVILFLIAYGSGVAGDYATTLSYTQTDVPISTDSSLNLILPILAKPIVQKIVGDSILG
jgi:hypothetical protein